MDIKNFKKIRIRNVKFTGKQGEPGLKGDPGHTPTREELTALIKPLIPEVKDGKTPTEAELLAIIKPLIPKVRDGKDGVDGHTPSNEELLAIIRPLIPSPTNGKDGQDGSPDTGEVIIDKINDSSGKKIKLSKIEPIPTAGPGHRLDATDSNNKRYENVELIKFGQNLSVSRDNTGKVTVNASGGSGSSTFLDLTDTPSSYTGQAGKMPIVNGTEDALIFATPTDTDEKVKLSASDPTAGYLDAKLNEGVTGVKAFDSAGFHIKGSGGNTAALFGSGGGNTSIFNGQTLIGASSFSGQPNRLIVIGDGTYSPAKFQSESIYGLQSGYDNSIGAVFYQKTNASGNGIGFSFNANNLSDIEYGTVLMGLNNIDRTGTYPIGDFEIFSRNSGGSITKKFSILTTGGIRFNNAYTFPAADGSANHFLKTDGSGNLSWASVSEADTWASVMARGNQSDTAGIIDVTNTEALLVRKNSDGGDVFIVDTTNSRIGINKTPTAAIDVLGKAGDSYFLYGTGETPADVSDPYYATGVDGSGARFDAGIGGKASSTEDGATSQAGVGGSILLYSGTGGDANSPIGTAHAGQGGDFVFQAGRGGASNGLYEVIGGAGGGMTIESGIGGAGRASDDYSYVIGGGSGDLSLRTSFGGSAIANGHQYSYLQGGASGAVGITVSAGGGVNCGFGDTTNDGVGGAAGSYYYLGAKGGDTYYGNNMQGGEGSTFSFAAGGGGDASSAVNGTGGNAGIMAFLLRKGGTGNVANGTDSDLRVLDGYNNFLFRIMGDNSKQVRIPTDNGSLVFGAGQDASIYYDGTDLIINPKLVGSGVLKVLGDISLINEDIILGTTTGTKIGTSTSQKIGFWNATPIVQPTTGVGAATFTANSGTAVNDASTFDGYTLKQVVKALRNLGLLA